MIPLVTDETKVTGLVFIPEMYETAAVDLKKSYDNVVHALGQLNVDAEEGNNVTCLLYYGRLSVDDINNIERDFCTPNIHLLGITGRYKDFMGDAKCEVVLRPVNDNE